MHANEQRHLDQKISIWATFTRHGARYNVILCTFFISLLWWDTKLSVILARWLPAETVAFAFRPQYAWGKAILLVFLLDGWIRFHCFLFRKVRFWVQRHHFKKWPDALENAHLSMTAKGTTKTAWYQQWRTHRAWCHTTKKIGAHTSVAQKKHTAGTFYTVCVTVALAQILIGMLLPGAF